MKRKLRDRIKTAKLENIKKKPLITGLIVASLFTTEHHTFITHNGDNNGK